MTIWRRGRGRLRLGRGLPPGGQREMAATRWGPELSPKFGDVMTAIPSHYLPGPPHSRPLQRT